MAIERVPSVDHVSVQQILKLRHLVTPFHETLKATAQTLTGTWAQLGSEVNCAGLEYISLWLDIDINLSVDVQIRLLPRRTTGGSNATLPIRDNKSSVIRINRAYQEINEDTDNLQLIPWELNRLVPYCIFQIKAGTVGATAGIIKTSYMTMVI